MSSNIVITIKDIRSSAIKEGSAVRKYKLNSETSPEQSNQTFEQIVEAVGKKFTPEKIKSLAKKKGLQMKNEDLSKANINLAEIADKPVERPSRKFGKVKTNITHRLSIDASRIPSEFAGGADRAEETEMVLDTILEARRGRPRKDGSSKPDGEDEGGREHIIVQLRKAENLRGDRHTEFNDSEKHKLPVEHVKKALNMHMNMKPMEKEKFEKRLATSHKSFMSAIRGEPEEAAKPKITLGSMVKKSVREDADPRVITSDRKAKEAITVTKPDGSKEVVLRAPPRKEIEIESYGYDESDDLNEELMLAEEELLNNLYEKLSDSNKVMFEEMLETEDGYFKLLQFAAEQDI